MDVALVISDNMHSMLVGSPGIEVVSVPEAAMEEQMGETVDQAAMEILRPREMSFLHGRRSHPFDHQGLTSMRHGVLLHP
jgi:hypothetical protein